MSVAKLTRRERVAMELALECLRVPGRRGRNFVGAALSDAIDALLLADRPWLPTSEVVSALSCGTTEVYELILSDIRRHRPGAGVDRRIRMFRARLALYLRARMRVDRGDYGRLWVWVTPAGREHEFSDEQYAADFVAHAGGHARRRSPLWEQAGLAFPEVTR